MSEVLEKQSTELVELPAYENALQVFTTEKALDSLYSEVESKVSGFVYDMSTKKGRDQCASDAYKIARTKQAVEKLGAKLSAEYKEIPKKIDASRRRIKERFDALQERIRQPLNEWEAAEDARVSRHKTDLAMLDGFEQCSDLSADQIRANIDSVEDMAIGEEWEEFEAEAHRVKASVLAAMRSALATREKYEAEQAELARLRAEAEARAKRDEQERIAREAAERAQREAEAKAQAEREAAAKREAQAKADAERRELELKLQAEKAERERLEAIERAEKEKRDAEERHRQAIEAERKRQADEAARIEAEAKAREADRAHKTKILRTAKEAVMNAGITEDQAREVIKLIAAGQVPNVRINY